MRKLTFNQPTAAGTVGITLPVSGNVVSIQATTSVALSSNPSRIFTDLQSPIVGGQIDDVFTIANLSMAPIFIPFPVSAGEVIYCVFSGKGVAVVYVDD